MEKKYAALTRQSFADLHRRLRLYQESLLSGLDTGVGAAVTAQGDSLVDAGVADPVQKSDEGNRTSKAQFGRKHTHNEQLVVYTCGVIGGRATMFGAEPVTGVRVCARHHHSF